MKIYLAYRSAYFPNSRFLNEFEEESILKWFQKNWEIFTKEEADENEDYIQVLGTNIYGFPIWQIDNEPVPGEPKNLIELKSSIEKFIYNNEVIVDKDCIKVLTDDDEIELAWFIFTENYKQKYWDKVSIWFHKEIPTNFGETGKELTITKEILPKGIKKGFTYFVSCPIYDGANLEDLEGVYKIEGIRLPDLLGHLKSNDLVCDNKNDFNYSFKEINFIKSIAEKSKSTNLGEVLSICSKIPITEFDDEEYHKLDMKELLELDLRNNPEKSSVKESEHFYEICINSIEEFYNYWILFDDLWVEKNQELASSILKFGSDWKI